MRGSLKSILSRVERIRADVVGRAGETNWDDLVARLQSVRHRPPVEPAAETEEEIRANARELRRRLAEAGMRRW